MKHLPMLALLLLALGFGGCGSDSSRTAETSPADSLAALDSINGQLQSHADSLQRQSPDSLARFFDKYGLEGGFVLYDPQAGRYLYHNLARIDSPMIPASTFKIPHALIALETGALPSAKTVLPWDGTQHAVAAWNQDQTLETALQHSTVWAFQEIARRVGPKRMQHYLNLMEYGNRDMGGGIDQFWLTGDLRISMREQTQFIRLFYKEELPFSRSAFQTVKKALTRQETDRYTLVAKTGRANGNPTDLGWYVGYLLVYPPLPPDLPDSLRVKMPKPAPKGYYFATTIEIRNDEDVALREGLTLEILRYLNLMPQ